MITEGGATAIAIACSLCAGAIAGQSWSLQTDWQETSNPGGPDNAWSLREGVNALPHVDAWQQLLGGWSEPQPAWSESSDGNNRLPMWMKSNGSETFPHDWTAGEIVVHSTDGTNGVGNGDASVVWISPIRGIVSVAGAVWQGRDIGRSNDWSLRVDGQSLTGGSLFTGDPWSSAKPLDLSAGSGGAAALEGIEVCEGSEIELRVIRTSLSGDFVVVNLAISVVVEYPPCAADLSGDCTVNGSDLALLLGSWGTNGIGDINGSGSVNGADLSLLLGAWGDCPTAP